MIKVTTVEESRKQLSKEIKKLRIEKGLKKKSLAKKLGIAINTIVKVESGESGYNIDNYLLILKEIQNAENSSN